MTVDDYVSAAEAFLHRGTHPTLGRLNHAPGFRHANGGDVRIYDVRPRDEIRAHAEAVRVYGFAFGLFLLLSGSLIPWLAVVFPAWIFMFCVHIYRRSRSIPPGTGISKVRIARTRV